MITGKPTVPTGMSVYVRRISKSRHVDPKAFAEKCAQHGLTWVALMGAWQDPDESLPHRLVNTETTLVRYARALHDVGIQPWIWGYPWQGMEELFAEDMCNAAHACDAHILLDPELGANPTRAKRGPGKQRANDHAKRVVELIATHTHAPAQLGLSTFGRGWKIPWFPLLAYTQALIEHYPGKTFVGGQTYTDNRVVDTSIADMREVIERAGGQVMRAATPIDRGCAIVPNYGLYLWRTHNGRRAPGAKARSKTKEELAHHLMEFVNEKEPVNALIGWAENFLTPSLWGEIARFSRTMARGCTRV